MSKTYKLTLEKSDNTTEEITFTVPQGDKGETGDKGATGGKGPTGDAGVVTRARSTTANWSCGTPMGGASR